MLIVIFVNMPTTYGISINDFIPSSLEVKPSSESSNDPQIAFGLPEETQKRADNAYTSTKNCKKAAGSIFCGYANESINNTRLVNDNNKIMSKITNGNSNYFNRNTNKYNQNVVNTFNMTDSNQTTMQVYSPQLNNTNSPSDQVRDNVTLPLKPSKNTNINIGQQQIEFNIKY